MVPFFIICLSGITVFTLSAHLAIGRNGLLIRHFDLGVFIEKSMGATIALLGLAIISYAILTKSSLGLGYMGHVLLLSWKFAIAGFCFGYLAILISYILE